MNPLKKLQDFGQSVYMDEIRRSMMSDGYLKTLIERDGLRGVTSNPAIFQKAIADSSDYDEAIAAASEKGTSVEQLNRIEERTAAAGGYGALIAIGIAPVMILVALGLAISGEVQEGASLALAAGVLGAVLIVHAVLAVTGAIARLLSSRLLGGDSILVSVASAERVAAQVRILDRQGVLEHGAGLEQILDVAYRALGAPRASESEISELLEAPVLDSAARRRFPAGR